MLMRYAARAICHAAPLFRRYFADACVMSPSLCLLLMLFRMPQRCYKRMLSHAAAAAITPPDASPDYGRVIFFL